MLTLVKQCSFSPKSAKSTSQKVRLIEMAIVPYLTAFSCFAKMIGVFRSSAAICASSAWVGPGAPCAAAPRRCRSAGGALAILQGAQRRERGGDTCV